MTIGDDLTPAQCRAARALLHWSQADLANKASVAKRTVSYFESDLRPLNLRTRRALADALNKAGITVDAHGGIRRDTPAHGGVPPALHETAREEAGSHRDHINLEPAGDTDIARRWRMRAEEYRTVADAMRTAAAQQAYARLARTYDDIARHMEKRSRGSRKKQSTASKQHTG